MDQTELATVIVATLTGVMILVVGWIAGFWFAVSRKLDEVFAAWLKKKWGLDE